mmetsp:Transcript_64171/g.143435  ORF Transcript_64171/g.143435 Transcript_64171/m.143435 type:complete len:121 (+) Transcript_64171:640-1002(+)
MTLPLLTTAIWSASRIVDSRCVIVIVVRFCFATTWSSAACTTFSLSLSSADVASSSSSTAGFLISARAIATRCFCPPLSCVPPSPTCVSYPSLRSEDTKSCAFAIFAASSISSCVAPSLP